LIKSIGKLEHGCCDHKTSRNITCCVDMREIFFLRGEGGLVVCRWGELGLGRRRRNMGGEGRQSCQILTFSTVSPPTETPSVITSVILMETSTRHRTDLPFQIPR